MYESVCHYFFYLNLFGCIYKMGKKFCVGSSDTPLVTLDSTFVNVNRSHNVTVDVTDSGPQSDREEEEDIPRYRRCCCLLWRRRRPKNENGEKKMEKKRLAFHIVPST